MAPGEIKGEEREKPFCFNDLACYVFFSFPFFHPRVIFTHFEKNGGIKKKEFRARIGNLFFFPCFFLFYLLCFSAVGLSLLFSSGTFTRELLPLSLSPKKNNLNLKFNFLRHFARRWAFSTSIFYPLLFFYFFLDHMIAPGWILCSPRRKKRMFAAWNRNGS